MKINKSLKSWFFVFGNFGFFTVSLKFSIFSHKNTMYNAISKLPTLQCENSKFLSCKNLLSGSQIGLGQKMKIFQLIVNLYYRHVLFWQFFKLFYNILHGGAFITLHFQYWKCKVMNAPPCRRNILLSRLNDYT